MGYGDAQVRELEATIEAADCDAVVAGTPIDLTRVLSVSKPMVRATYELREREPGVLAAALRRVLGG
jgi:predicted GTPase